MRMTVSVRSSLGWLQIWRSSGIQARRALFDNTVATLQECGVSLPRVPKAVA